jgi:hypothetical protein
MACIVLRTEANDTAPPQAPGDKGQLGTNNADAGLAAVHPAEQAMSALPPLQRKVHTGGPVSNRDTAGALGVLSAGQIAPVLSLQQTMAHMDEKAQAGSDVGDTSPTILAGPVTITPAGLQGLGPPCLQSGQPVVGNGT